ncbi:MAG TPA: vanadium-dependent haloperoxidase [Thermoanaerobaculia bacterium]|nr:vanadium-dependent haloperoxidase [Thermoanaerobaculia bacterium]
MSIHENVGHDKITDVKGDADASALSRRKFLGGLGGAAAVAATGVIGLEPAAHAAAAPSLEDFTDQAASDGPGRLRRNGSWKVRKDSADFWVKIRPNAHATNGDETRYANRIGNFSKGLPHNAFGEVDPAAYDGLLKACTTGDPDDFDAVTLAGTNKLVSPQGGLAFDLQGADAMSLTVPAPPAIASAEMASEMVEHYWMKALLDVNFLDYHNHPDVAAAGAELDAFGDDFKGPKTGGHVRPQTLFRDTLPGAKVGPYISQFMWKDTPFGTEYVERRQRTLLPDTDHLVDYDNWLAVQNGHFPESSANDFDPVRRYIRTGRDLAQWVHIDVLFQAYFNALLIMASSGFPPNPGNPYVGNKTQIGFTTFGPPHFATLLCEVSTRALKATWHKKWQVSRRLRPEAYGGRVHNQITANRYPGLLNEKLLNSEAVARVHDKYGTYLLPQVFPEGSPVHPSYTAGHATVAGACVTILKALFDENYVIPNPVVPTADGLELEPYHGPALTVRGELNKLASNVATGRNIAGVHWRSDALESMLLGEKVAISILRDQRGCYNEKFDGFTFTKFDGLPITV